MHCHFGTNNRASLQTRGEARSPGRAKVSCLVSRIRHECPWHKGYIWRLATGCGLTLYKKCHSHNTPGKRYNNTWVETLAENCTTKSKNYYSIKKAISINFKHEIFLWSPNATNQPKWTVELGYICPRELLGPSAVTLTKKLKEQDTTSDIEQQPPFGDRK